MRIMPTISASRVLFCPAKAEGWRTCWWRGSKCFCHLCVSRQDDSPLFTDVNGPPPSRLLSRESARPRAYSTCIKTPVGSPVARSMYSLSNEALWNRTYTMRSQTRVSKHSRCESDHDASTRHTRPTTYANGPARRKTSCMARGSQRTNDPVSTPMRTRSASSLNRARRRHVPDSKGSIEGAPAGMPSASPPRRGITPRVECVHTGRFGCRL